MVSWAEFLLVFLKVGALGFGGPFALLAFLEKEVTERRDWVTSDEFAHATAIGTMTPGPIFFGAAVHIGYHKKGLAGAVAAGITVLIPGFLAALALAAFYTQVESAPAARRISSGIASALVGLLAVMSWRMAVSALNKAHLWVIGAGAFLAMRIYRTDPAIVLLASSIAGMAVYLISHRSTRTPSGTEGN